jgi:hypothetical protein
VKLRGVADNKIGLSVSSSSLYLYDYYFVENSHDLFITIFPLRFLNISALGMPCQKRDLYLEQVDVPVAV